jgi:hypothetical protein
VLAQSLTQGFPARLPDAIKTTALGTRHAHARLRGAVKAISRSQVAILNNLPAGESRLFSAGHASNFACR